MLHSIAEATRNSKLESYGCLGALKRTIQILSTGRDVIPMNFDITPSVINEYLVYHVAGIGTVSVYKGKVTTKIDENELGNHLLYLLSRERPPIGCSPTLLCTASCDDELRTLLMQIGCGVIETGLARYQTYCYDDKTVYISPGRTPSGALSYKHTHRYAELDAEIHITFHGTKFPKEFKPNEYITEPQY